MQRAQSAAEYVTLMALVFVLVASLMLVVFRQQEANLALSSARLACMEYTYTNASITCNEMRYYYTGTQNITIVPIAQNLVTIQQRADLSAKIIKDMGQVFNNKNTQSSCLTAAYYSYCVSIP